MKSRAVEEKCEKNLEKRKKKRANRREKVYGAGVVEKIEGRDSGIYRHGARRS